MSRLCAAEAANGTAAADETHDVLIFEDSAFAPYSLPWSLLPGRISSGASAAVEPTGGDSPGPPEGVSRAYIGDYLCFRASRSGF